MKEIFLETEVEVDHLLGKYVTESEYDLIVDFDCDVYKPNNKIGLDPRDESLALIKFRKGVFSKEVCDQAFNGLKAAASKQSNRGIAAGPRQEKLYNRFFVTERQEAILEALEQTTISITGRDYLEEVEEAYEGKNEPNKRGFIWLDVSKTEGFVFEDWLAEVRTKSPEERKAASQFVQKRYVSTTTYGNAVLSGIVGYFDRYPRIPFCRETAYSANHPEKFEEAVPLIMAISEQFRQLMPGRYAYQREHCNMIDQSFLIAGTCYTTLTVNKNFQTACHYDAGDLEFGFGNIIALSNGADYDGGYTVFPKYRVGVDLRPGDMLCFDPHELHGNTEITSEKGDHERVSVVLYFRAKMVECESKQIEDLRDKFVKSRSENTSHPEWREMWNGISPGMFTSEEWIEFLLAHGMNDYVEETFTNKTSGGVSLDDFFD